MSSTASSILLARYQLTLLKVQLFHKSFIIIFLANPNAMDALAIDKLKSSHNEYLETWSSIIPSGKPVRFLMTKRNKKFLQWADKEVNPGILPSLQFPCFDNGGVSFLKSRKRTNLIFSDRLSSAEHRKLREGIQPLLDRRIRRTPRRSDLLCQHGNWRADDLPRSKLPLLRACFSIDENRTRK